MPFVFLDIAIIIVAARLMGRLFAAARPARRDRRDRRRHPARPDACSGCCPATCDPVLFPTDVRPYLTVIAQLGLVLFMFIVGLEVDLRADPGQAAHRPAAVSLARSCCRSGSARRWRRCSTRRTPWRPAQTGAARSRSRCSSASRCRSRRSRCWPGSSPSGGMHRTPIGVLALACAAIDDVVAWSLLAVVVAVAVGGSARRASARSCCSPRCSRW